MGAASGCGYKDAGVASGSEWNLCVVSRRWMWVESMGVVVRRYIDYIPHITYPYSSCICSFLQ